MASSPPSVHPHKKVGIQGNYSQKEVDIKKAVALWRDKVADAMDLAGWEQQAHKVRYCSQVVTHWECHNCGTEWDSPDRCWHRLCPECAPIRAVRLFEAHKVLVGQPNLKHLVLTIKNVPHLHWSSVTTIRRYFTRLRHRKLFRLAWRGGIYTIEFTYSLATGWHIHIHALIDGRYIPKAEISKHWLEITGDSEVVWIEAVTTCGDTSVKCRWRAKTARQNSEDKSVWACNFRGNCEHQINGSKQVLKYILKPTLELLNDPEELDSFLTVIQGRHLVAGFGKWSRVTEKSLLGVMRCPECGSTNIKLCGRRVAGTPFVSRSPPGE
ncbi:hypothetical protein ES708_23969 [subsurface metagenome]